MNLLDLYEMKDPRDAYQRDVDNSRVGMNRQSRADVTGEEEPSGIFTVMVNGRPWKTGSSNEMFALAGRIANKHSDKKVAVKWPTGELNTVKPQSVSEDSQRVDSLVTDALKIMQGSELNDAVSALKTVLGDREYNSRRNYYKFYVRQLMDMYGQQGVSEAQQLNVQQLATVSDEALDKAYGYGRSQPGNSFGWQANLKSAAFAKQMIDKGVTDIEAISDAIHKGWNTTAQAFVQNPEQFDDTAKLKAAGKLEAKLQQRAQLMKQNYGQLPEEEKEKDRVVARALLQALKGKQGEAAGSLTEDLQADDGEYYSNSDKFFGQFEINDIDFEESPDGMELRGYIDGVNVMAWRFKSAKKVGGWGIYDDSALSQQGVTEAEVDSDGHSVDHADSGEYDYEGDQARDQMNTIVRAARRLDGLLDDNENMPEWVQMKVTLAADYLDTAADYIESNQEPELDEGDRGRGRPPAGEQDTTPITPGRVEKTATGIRHHADASRYGGTEPDAEDDHLMSKSHISRLGKMTEPDLDEGDKIGNMDADKFDAAMARLKQLAGAGPLKTVYDPTKRVYRNVPVAVQPKK